MERLSSSGEAGEEHTFGPSGEPVTRPLARKGPGHDQRRCRFLSPNPAVDRQSLQEGVDRTRLPLFLCNVKGRPLFTTMRKCKFCRETGLWYEPRDDSPDALPMAGSSGRPPAG